MGACLLTDAKANLPCLFEPDQEVVTYSSPAEAVSKLKQLLAQPKAAAAIAARGQARTLKCHTYNHRMVELAALLQQHLPKMTPSVSQAPRPQTLLVVCRAEHVDRIPGPLKKALLNEHPNHRIALISDADPDSPDFKGMQRWCSPTLGQDATQAQSCLDAMEPDQIFLIEDLPDAPLKHDWFTQLKQQAHAREIPCSSMRLS